MNRHILKLPRFQLMMVRLKPDPNPLNQARDRKIKLLHVNKHSKFIGERMHLISLVYPKITSQVHHFLWQIHLRIKSKVMCKWRDHNHATLSLPSARRIKMDWPKANSWLACRWWEEAVLLSTEVLNQKTTIKLWLKSRWQRKLRHL